MTEILRDIKNISKSIHRQSLTLFNAEVEEQPLDPELIKVLQREVSDLYELSSKLK